MVRAKIRKRAKPLMAYRISTTPENSNVKGFPGQWVIYEEGKEDEGVVVSEEELCKDYEILQIYYEPEV